MNERELRERIQVYRRDYLETARGRAHLATAVTEAKEVRIIFAALTRQRHSGADITDDVLKHLLPHSDTAGNRQRGSRISTWPCITKDVRSWFEGAGWKNPHEWLEAAAWVCDIASAGSEESWPEWRRLAKLPIQRGFACGFITPIVHCLNTALPVINSKVVRTYAAVALALGAKDDISSNLADYPENMAKLLQMVKQLSPFGIVQLLEFDVFCHWSVDKRLGGREGWSGPRGDLVQPVKPAPPASPPLMSGVDELCERLQQSQFDTQNPDRFEAAIAESLRALGCEAEHVGGAGDADVVAKVALGEDRFAFVVDAKTCQRGSTRASLNYQPIRKHQELHEADYAIVVAPGFAGGDTERFARESKVGLMTTDTLIALLQHHSTVGLSLPELKDIVSRHGPIVINPPLQTRLKSVRDRTHVVSEALRTFEVHDRLEESSSGLDAKAVYFLLKGEGHKFTLQQVEFAVELLANPLISVLEKRGALFVLTLPADAARTRFALFANDSAPMA